MKKILCTFLIVLILTSFTACGKTKQTENSSEIINETADISAAYALEEVENESLTENEFSSGSLTDNSDSVTSVEITESQTVFYIENNLGQSSQSESLSSNNNQTVSEETQKQDSSNDNWTAYH